MADDHRPSWDQTWIAVAHVMGARSRCDGAQIGAVIVSANGRIAATGFNGPAATWPQDGSCDSWCPRRQPGADRSLNYDLCPAIHAEANALMYVDRSRVEGGTIYACGSMCMNCAKLVSNSGIKRVVHVVHSEDAHRKPELVEQYLRTCGIEVVRA